jgi:uncharacterized protein YdeI (BOF family)
MRALISGLLLVLALSVSGCGSKERVLGKMSSVKLSSILAINAGDAPGKLALQGTLIDKCPQAGCWFHLDDGTGVIKVDTKSAGFVVTQIPLNAKVKVAGLLQQDGEEVQLRATGLTY